MVPHEHLVIREVLSARKGEEKRLHGRMSARSYQYAEERVNAGEFRHALEGGGGLWGTWPRGIRSRSDHREDLIRNVEAPGGS